MAILAFSTPTVGFIDVWDGTNEVKNFYNGDLVATDVYSSPLSAAAVIDDLVASGHYKPLQTEITIEARTADRAESLVIL